MSSPAITITFPKSSIPSDIVPIGFIASPNAIAPLLTVSWFSFQTSSRESNSVARVGTILANSPTNSPTISKLLPKSVPSEAAVSCARDNSIIVLVKSAYDRVIALTTLISLW